MFRFSLNQYTPLFTGSTPGPTVRAPRQGPEASHAVIEVADPPRRSQQLILADGGDPTILFGRRSGW
jgi:hypothetical protein